MVRNENSGGEKNRLGFYQENSPIVCIDELSEQDIYDVAMRGPAYNFIHESGIVTGNSHSYCVAIDSFMELGSRHIIRWSSMNAICVSKTSLETKIR